MNKPRSLDGASALVRLLHAAGVREAFGIAGGKMAPLLRALGPSGIRWTGVRHEASAAMMAAACCAGSGTLAVALADMGPGALNLAAGAGVAANNHLPVLLLTTNQHRLLAYPHRGFFMDADTSRLMAPLTKWSAVVHDARRLPELLHTALRHAFSGAPGPVHLDLPHDVLNSVVDWPAGMLEWPLDQAHAQPRPRPDAAALAQAQALIGRARRPLLIAGGGAVASDATDVLRSLAARLQAPLLPTQMGLGSVSSDSLHFIGQGGLVGGRTLLRALAEADLVIAAGCRFSSWWWDQHGPLVRDDTALVNINTDALALSAPAPHRVALLADARAALDELLAGLPTAATDGTWLPGLRQAWLDEQAAWRAAEDDGDPVMHPGALARRIGTALPANARVVYDGGHTSFWSNSHTPVHAPRTRFHEPGMCQLGFGLPFALALQRLYPGQPVLQITGDGSFGFTLAELDTARREHLPVLSIVHNNGAWGVIRQGQRAHGGFELGTDLGGTDYAAISRGFGCHGEVVQTLDEVAPAMARALASGLPAVLDCRTRFVPHPCMPAFGSMNRYGS